jgi:hypothetical protein
MRYKIRLNRASVPFAGLLLYLGAASLWPSSLDAATSVVLNCTIIDASSGAPLAARCRVVDASGLNRFPFGLTSFYHSGGGGYFYTAGSFSCTLAGGGVVVTVKHGFTYRESVTALQVRADTSIVIGLERIVSLDSLSLYPGDTHVHINHAGGFYVLDPEDALLMAGAEGLSMVNCLDNGYYFTGAAASCSTPECFVFMSEEARSSCYGHFGLLGLHSLVEPEFSTWWPMAMDIADSVHAQDGALVIAAHPVSSDSFWQVEAWPGSGIARELPVDCISHRIDAMDILSYSNCHDGGIELDMWYRLLNCGFRIPASAGTDACMNRLDSYPLGGFQTFVRVDGPLSPESWFEALAAGRTFVTNGPLITRFEIARCASGDSMRFARPVATIPGKVSVRSAFPVDRIEIVQNGAPAVTMLIEPPRGSVDTSFSLPLSESSWFAARVRGPKQGWITAGGFLFAHTSPVYLRVGDGRILERDDAEFFEYWVEDLELLAHAKGQWPDTARSSRVFRELAAARFWYAALKREDLPSGDEGHPELPSALRCLNAPNPFSDGTVIAFTVPAAAGRPAAGLSRERSALPVRLTVYDASGRLLRRLVEAPLESGSYRVAWDGRDERGRSVSCGVYFAKLSAGGRSFSRKMVVVR